MTANERLHYTQKLDSVLSRWAVKHQNTLKWLDYVKFARFIGYPEDPERNFVVDIENPEVQRIIDLAYGPHGDTILKMLEIKNANRKF